ncbi:hypothetical protein HID58_094630 [Brassica napus]|uniref:Protein kinase domain-containing protein n=1 Tax=Brassica napus TaxID=3708 RepID=A0ABQ7X6P2_BRANA|nr:hypothetical protein HID58_094630 [Brassica napus]
MRRISIPFPFGIGPKHCYLNDWYKVVCNTTTTTSLSTPFLSKINRELMSITHFKKQLTAPKASFTSNLRCESRLGLDKICSGYRCFQAMITADRPQVIGVDLESSAGGNTTLCKVAFLTKETYSPANVIQLEKISSNGFTVIGLEWFFDASLTQLAKPVGCFNLTGDDAYDTSESNIDECEGELGQSRCGGQTCVNVPGSFRCVPKKIEKIKPVRSGYRFGTVVLGSRDMEIDQIRQERRKIIRKREFFKRNGGLLLNTTNYRRRSSKELEKATDNFNKNRVLGQGGQGTVYKGMLVDGRIIAVKRSKINHRNILKLMGCCLETEVPILVYEHIPNGDLFKRLHNDSDDYTMTWKSTCLLALGCIYTGLSQICQDQNILLDEKYRAKVSDFGTSRSISIDQTHLTTHVAENRGLASHFIEAMKENRVLDIVDSRIKEECKPEQVLALAKLARRCLSLKGKKHPSMRVVSSDLEKIRSSLEDLEVTIEEEEEEEEMPIEINIDDSWSVDMTAPASLFDLSPTLDVEPLVPQ